MKAASGDLPSGPDWVFELKWDGMRILADIRESNSSKDGSHEIKLFSGNGIEATERFPELRGLGDAVAVPAVLDGEVVAIDADGLPSFAQLQHRIHFTGNAATLAADNPVAFVIFDVIEVQGQPLSDVPWDKRRRLLEQIVEPGPFWQLSTTHDDGEKLFAAVIERSLEGVMAKRRDSLYRGGSRSPQWRKVKHRDVREFVVGGWATGMGDRTGSLGSLLIGHHIDGELHYAGRVGSGINQSEQARLLALLDPIGRPDSSFVVAPETIPGRDIHHVQPIIVVQVAVGGWTTDRHVRHPSYLGQRIDVEPDQVIDQP